MSNSEHRVPRGWDQFKRTVADVRDAYNKLETTGFTFPSKYMTRFPFENLCGSENKTCLPQYLDTRLPVSGAILGEVMEPLGGGMTSGGWALRT